MEEDGCPRCKTTKYRNPSLKLLVNICGHTLCENCVELLFVKGANTCPECQIPLRRNNYRVQLFDPMVEKELDIRRRILRDYNKKEEDFETLEEYNTYLEEIESIIFNLTNNIDILETNKKIEAYKKDHREQIRSYARSGRLGKDEVEIEILLEQEKEMIEMRNQVQGNLEDLSKKKTTDKEKLIDELMFSSENAHSILKSYASKVEESKKEQELLAPPPPKVTKFSSGINFSSNFQQQYLPVPKTDDGPTYVYSEPVFALHNGPAVPPLQEIAKYSKHIRTENNVERAGGFQSKISCYRALQEAMQGLYPFVIE